MTRAITHIFGIALAAALALPGIAGAQEGGGQPAPGPSAGTLPADPGFTISTRRALFRGSSLRINGQVARGGGRVVRIERQDAGVWLPVTAVQANRDGTFSTVWRPESRGRQVLRAVLETGEANAASSGPRASNERAVIVYEKALATWYGPGFYGNRTACGQRLTERTQGVAHRDLPCGTVVALYYRGRRANVRVIDRGPYAHGADWDLTGATAQRLGFTATSQIGAVPIGR